MKIMRLNKKNKLALIIGVIILAVILISVKNGQAVRIKCRAYQASDILPVVYLESGLGSYSYKTNMLGIKGNKTIKLGRHFRSYSNTYPEKALLSTALKHHNIATEYLGQLMSYYNTVNGEIFLFDSYTVNPSLRKYTIINDNAVAVLDYGEKEIFFEMLGKEDRYYILCYDIKKTEIESDDFNIINVYEYSKDLKFISKNVVDLSQNNLTSWNIQSTGITISSSRLIIPIIEDNKYFSYIYDLSKKTGYKKLEFNKPICRIVAEDKVYCAGIKDKDFLFEVRDLDDNILLKQKCEMFGEDEKVNQYVGNIYLHDNKILGAFYNEKGVSIFIYNIEKNQWESWINVEEKSGKRIMSYKFMAKSGDSYYDLYY